MKSSFWGGKDFRITQGFGPTSLTLEPAFRGYPHFHKGIDVAMPTGTPIYAFQDGTCVNGTDQYGGKYQLITNRDGSVDFIDHLNDWVASGQVKKGQLISHSGSTGLSTGPHAHIEHRLNSNRDSVVDPAEYLQGGDDMIDWKYLPDGSVFKYDDSPTVYWAVPSQEAYTKYIGDGSRIKTIPNPDKALNEKIAFLTNQVTDLNNQNAALQKQLRAASQSPSNPQEAQAVGFVSVVIDWLRGLLR